MWIYLVVGFFAFTGIALFGDSPQFRNTWINKIHSGLHKLNSKLFYFLTKWLDSHPLIIALSRWTVPCFYIGLMSTVIAYFFRYVFPQLPLGIKDSPLQRVAMLLTIASLGASTSLATFTDPGTLTPQNAHSACSVFPYNNIIFFGKTCPTCQLPKPARSKHCSECDRCVLLFDHHCLWVNNCIGLNNYRWFLAYLILNIVLIIYGSVLCCKKLQYSKASNTVYFERSYWSLIKNSSFNNEVAGILLILGVCLAPLVIGFLCLHLRYLYLGVTTNEIDKWGDISYLVSLGALFYVPEIDTYVERAHSQNMAVYIHLGSEKILFRQQDTSHLGYTLLQVKDVETDLKNIYDRGLVNNFLDRVLRLPVT